MSWVRCAFGNVFGERSWCPFYDDQNYCQFGRWKNVKGKERKRPEGHTAQSPSCSPLSLSPACAGRVITPARSTSTQLPLTCIVYALSTLQRGLVQSTRALYPWMASYERPFMLPLVYISARTNQGFLCTLCIVYISSLFSSKNIASAYTPLLL